MPCQRPVNCSYWAAMKAKTWTGPESIWDLWSNNPAFFPTEFDDPARIQSVDWFIQYQDGRFANHGDSKAETLLLSERKCFALAFPFMVNAGKVQHFFRFLSVRSKYPTPPNTPLYWKNPFLKKVTPCCRILLSALRSLKKNWKYTAGWLLKNAETAAL